LTTRAVRDLLYRVPTDRVVGVIVAAVGLAIVLATRDLALVDRIGPGPALAPAAVGLALATCGLLMAVLRQPADAAPAPRSAIDRRAMLALAAILLASILVERLGLLAVATVLAYASARLMPGTSTRASLAVAVFVGIAVAALSAWLGLPLFPMLGGLAGRVL
jgi:hypothetical protein